MNIWIGIPTGQRGEKAEKAVRAWGYAGLNVAVYSWDGWTTRLCKDLADRFFEGERKSFAILQNMMAAAIPDWDVYVCGADDLFPDRGTHLIGPAADECPGSVIWAADGLFNKQATHPIITRGWYEKHGRQIFDEQFDHNFCDTDLFIRTMDAKELIKCFDIQFDHRHYLKTGKKPDEIYELGGSTFRADQKKFDEKHRARPPVFEDVHEIKMG